MIKVFVFDTNSLISANLLPNSVNRKAYDRAREIGIPVYSTDTLEEFIEVFSRPKFDNIYPLKKDRMQFPLLKKQVSVFRFLPELVLVVIQKTANSLN